MQTAVAETTSEPRLGRLDLHASGLAPLLVVNPHAGQKLGIATNQGTLEATSAALNAAGVPFEPEVTTGPGHATELARRAAREGRALVIAAGGDGTIGEVVQALAGSDTALGVMPLGSFMNVARTLCVPRDLDAAARVIAEGRLLAMDLGEVAGSYFLEAAGVGLDAALFSYFDRLEHGARLEGVLRGAIRFMRALGTPRIVLELDGRRRLVRAPMVGVSNGPFVGASYSIAPDARIDDGLLDVTIFHEASIVRVLLYIAASARRRRLPELANVETVRARDVRVATRHRRPLPVHANGSAVGVTPVRFRAIPAALRVLVGQPGPDQPAAWIAPPEAV